MTARFLIGDTRERLGDIPDHTVDLVLTSPPFLALRSYLPEGHPDKAKEIGSEATPAEFIDVLLELTAAWGRVLAPHGSIAVELGDTYARSGGAGGDYGEDGLRAGQPRFRQRNDGGQYGNWPQGGTKHNVDMRPIKSSEGWPLPKSLACIPQLYQVALAYGINPLTGAESPAGRWRVRTLKPWIRSNPPVGALGDKERPATSYVIVACRAADRWFDLDAVRTPSSPLTNRRTAAGVTARPNTHKSGDDERTGGNRSTLPISDEGPGGAPPRDWWHHVDAVLDTELALRAGKYNGGENPAGSDMGHHGRLGSGDGTNNGGKGRAGDEGARSMGAQGVHLRRALERAGILTTLEALDVSPKGYSGAHYAVWPPELVRLLVNEMCPRRVCTVCGEPSRRITEKSDGYANRGRSWADEDTGRGKNAKRERNHHSGQPPGDHITAAEYVTLGWSDCGHNDWRPGHVLDPFAGSGTTLAVAQGMGRQATGIDLDERNAWLARERVGMFLDIDQPQDVK